MSDHVHVCVHDYRGIIPRAHYISYNYDMRL